MSRTISNTSGWQLTSIDLPAPKDYNPKLSRQVLKSMLAHGFFDHLSYKPVIGPPIEKVKIPGYSQLSEPPLYYWLASIPAPVDPRSEASMCSSMQPGWSRCFFLLITVLAGWGVACELVQPGHPLRWMLPLTIAMTACVCRPDDRGQ